jgi:phosphotransferase system  glucose/maltose/N-acetylglucosamine-specific IIC component
MDALIPIVLFITMFGMIFGIVYLRSRENMAMLERGLNPRQDISKAGVIPRSFLTLKFGLLLACAALGALIAYLLDNQVISHQMFVEADGLQRRADTDPSPLYPILMGLGGGIGLIISYLIERRYWEKNKNNV